MFRLDGRTALVTGGSRGIGKMIADGFLQSGAKKVYICSRKIEACEAVASELGIRCIPLPHDLSNMSGIKALVAEYTAREQSLDILVNNAGAVWGAPFEDFPETGWDKVLNLNLKSPFFLTQALHGHLKAGAVERPSKVINIGSIDGITLNEAETYSYHASKAALVHLTRRMAARLVTDNIVVTAIAPGAFASEMNRAARDRADVVASHIPLSRIGEKDDIAAAAVYLAARSGDYVVGATLPVDGGMSFASITSEGISI